MAVIGIDLGTTNSLCTVWRDGGLEYIPNAFGEYLTPSVVSLDEDGQVLVGKIARERLVSHPERTAAGFKCHMGTNKAYQLGSRTFLPEDLSSLVLRQLKADAEAYLDEEVTEAVVSVPAYFSDNQRASTKIAGTMAGLPIHRLINEPSAAALTYRHRHAGDGLYLVFDFGGGTLDVSVVDIFDNIVDIVAVSGDNRLGGGDIDRAIVQAFFHAHPGLEESLTDRERAALTRQAEQCKIALSSSPAACLVLRRGETAYELSLTEEDLIELSAPLLSRCQAVLERAVRDSGKTIWDLTEVIAVGGSSKMPMIRQYLEYLTHKKPRTELNPDRAVAAGAGIVTGIMARRESIRDTVLTDICPFSLGISTLSEGQIVFSPIIERNTALPVSNRQYYVTTRDNQTKVAVDIYQGEALNPKKNLHLGTLEIDIPPAPAGEVGCFVRFSYDLNGILDVDVHCPASGDSRHKLIVSNRHLTDEEVQHRLAVLEELKVSPREQSDNKLLIARAERLFAETVGQDREEVRVHLAAFMRELDRNSSPAALEKQRRALDALLTELEP